MKVLVGRILRPFIVTLGALTLFAGFTQPVFAQGKGSLEEIVVTARYRQEKLQDTPIAITAITAHDLQVRGFTSSYEIGYTVPNASLRPAQAAFGNTMTAYIRGIGQYDFNFAFEPGVAIYVDDVYQPFTLGSEVDLMDLERVEVLRGPQGTLFGRGAIGGAIRYVSKKPEGDNTGYIQVTTGDYSRIDVRAGYDFALTKNLFARVSGVTKHRQGYQDVIDFACAHPLLAGGFTPKTTNRGNNCKIGTQGGQDVSAVRGIIRWVASDDFELTLSTDYSDDSSEAKADTLTNVDTAAGYPSFASVPFDTRFIPPSMYKTYATYDDPNNNLSVKPQNGMKKWTVSGKGVWKMTNDITATGVVAYTKLDGTLSTDADQSPINIQLVDGIEDVYYFQGELRFSGRLWDRMDWTVGGFYYQGKSTDTQMVSFPFLSLILDGNPPTSAIPFVNSNNIHKNYNQSGFGTAVYDITSQLSFTAGVRFSHDRKEVNFDNTRVQNPNVVVDNTHFDWKVGLNYQWTDDIMTYASVSTGYRPGSYNPRPFQASQVVSVKQEESTAYELGIKSDWLDRTMRVNLAGFYTDWSTRILPAGGTECLLISYPPAVYATVPPGTPGAVTDTLGNTCLITVPYTSYQNQPGKIYGFEAEVTWHPTEALTLNGAYGLTEWDSPDVNGDPTVTSNYPPYVPKQNWTVSASYEMPVLGNGSTLTPRVDVYGQSKICSQNVFTFSTFPDASCTKAYELINFRMEYASPNRNWTLAAGVNNATDQEYYLNKFDLTAFGQPTAEGQPGHPREWYVTVRRNFD
jgi:iron complex outermembrane receptor protein